MKIHFIEKTLENNYYLNDSIKYLTPDFIARKILLGERFIFFSYQLTSQEEDYIIEIIEEILKKSLIFEKFNCIKFCIKEILENAKKANLKRLFFKEKGLDIHRDDDYKIGMMQFKDTVSFNIDNYTKLLEKYKYKIEVDIYLKDKDLFFSIINSAEIVESELLKAREKITFARRFDKLEDALAVINSSKEGAGLGLIIVSVLLKELGFSSDSLSINKKDGETEVLIKLIDIFK